MKAGKLILMFVLLPVVSAMAVQPHSNKLFYTIQQLQQRNGWLESQNGAALSTYEEANFSNASVSGFVTNGSLRNVCDPANNQKAALNAQSYYRLNNIMLYGQFLFDYDVKKNQCWTSMTYPGSSTLLIGDKTPGNQVRETYYINGGIGIPLGAGFTIGGYFDFKGVNNAKKKDIRNKNDYGYYHIKPSLMWERGAFRIGGNYSFGAETEKIEWLVAGDKMQHEVFFFEGLWFGPSQMTSSLITERRIERLVHEGALQMEYKIGQARLFNQFRFNKEELAVFVEVEEERGGENKKAGYAYEGMLWLPASQFTHSLKWSGDHSFVKSYQNLQQRELVNYIYRYVQYGTLLRYTESEWNAGLRYELAHIRNNNTWNRSWSLTLDGDFSFHNQKFRTYPTLFTQQIRQINTSVGFEKNLLFSKSMLDLGLEVFWKTGWGNPVDVSAPNSANGYKYQEELQKAEYAYLTAQLAGCGVSAKYTWFQNALTGFAPYAKASCFYREAIADALKNKSRTHVELTLGLNF